MRHSDPIVRVARAAIGRAKRRGDDEVTPDDLLVGALGELARFGVAVVGPWTFDLHALEEAGGEGGGEGDRGGRRAGALDGDAGAAGGAASAPRYSEASVAVFEAAVRAAREDGAPVLGLVHLLVALGEREDGLMARLRERHGFTPAEWRAALAREPLGPAWTGSDGSPGSDGAPGSDTVPGSSAAGTPELLSVDRAASFLGVHAQTVRNYIRAGKLPAYRLAGERFIRVLRRDLLALLEPVEAEDAQEAEAPEVELPVDLSLEEA